jgi:hypothetical protein
MESILQFNRSVIFANLTQWCFRKEKLGGTELNPITQLPDQAKSL